MRGSQALPQLLHSLIPQLPLGRHLLSALRQPSIASRSRQSLATALESLFTFAFSFYIIIRALFSPYVFRYHLHSLSGHHRRVLRIHPDLILIWIRNHRLHRPPITQYPRRLQWNFRGRRIGSHLDQWSRMRRPSRGPPHPQISISLPQHDPSGTSAWSLGQCLNLLAIHLGDRPVQSCKFAQMSNLA